MMKKINDGNSLRKFINHLYLPQVCNDFVAKQDGLTKSFFSLYCNYATARCVIILLFCNFVAKSFMDNGKR